ncbi:unnamed protein product [Amoebophrya sp. A25]|nr:unnamed protein product [Amoebophrya sp. A25]|eukprot:GSA25T00022463001.1
MGYAKRPLSVAAAGWSEDRGMRQEMEDGFVFVDGFLNSSNFAFFAVYDGHGGMDAMQYCQDFVHQNCYLELSKLLERDKAAAKKGRGGEGDTGEDDSTLALSASPEEVANALIYAFKTTDVSLIEIGVQAGATACCCLVAKHLFKDTPADEHPRTAKYLYAAHLGDARAVLCRRGHAARLTSMTDHKANCPKERARVHQEGGTIIHDRVNGMLAIARAFGDYQLKVPFQRRDIVSNLPDVTGTEIYPEDDLFVILACDGLWDVCSDQEAVTWVLEALTEFHFMGIPYDHPRRAELCSRILVEAALGRGSTDNVTVQIVFL